MSSTKYTKATEYGKTALGNTLPEIQDALYIGRGSFYENVTAAELHDPVLWLNAQEIVRSGVAIGQMTDLSGNDYHAVQSDADYKPTLDDNALNTLGVIDFADASGGDYLVVADNNDLDFSGDFEMMILIRVDEDGGYDTFLAKDTINNKWSWVHAHEAGGGVVKFFSVGNDPVGVTELVLEKWYILGISRTSGIMQLYLDGETDGDPSDTNTNDFSSTDDLYIGARWSGSAVQQMFEGGIGELLIWDGSLSTEERASVIRYIQDKWFTSPIPADFKTVLNTEVTIYRRQPCGQVLELQWDTLLSFQNTAHECVGLKK